MKRAVTIGILGAAALLVWSCGSDRKIIDPFAVVETGTSSLLIVAEINGAEDIGSGTFSTSYLVTILDSLNQPVNDAVVTLVHGQLGTIALPWNSLTPGSYSASASSYTEGAFLLNVVRGTDWLVNAQVTAPDLHLITFPTVADTLQADQPFDVTWSRVTAAASITVETRDFGPALSAGVGADNGSYLVPASLNIRDDQRVRVWRTNSTVLNTGLPGSSFSAEIRNAIEPIVVE